jgi:pantoate--beta-alanine ligase
LYVFKTIGDLQYHLLQHKESGEKIGFVPTMGALHEGHMSLVKKAQLDNDIVVVSIFVNPIQFNNLEDLAKYPRDLEKDIQLLKERKCSVLFCPEVDEMYPEKSESPIDLGNITEVLEASFRPGHFDGVSVVVKRLFEIVEPNNAYFGLKDYQQYVVVKTMTEKLGLNVNIVGCPTERDSNGLALSSRNLLLSKEGREKALLFYNCLEIAKTGIGNKSIDEIKGAVKKAFVDDRAIELEYFDIVNALSLLSITDLSEGESIVACIAGYVEGVRLIDNLILIP